MAVSKMRAFHPPQQSIEDLDLSQVVFDFDRRADILSVYFHGHPAPSIEVVVDDHMLLSVDPETEAIIGVQLDGFLAHAVYEFPALLEIGDLIGLTKEELAQIREGMSRDTRTRIALESVLNHAEPLRKAG